MNMRIFTNETVNEDELDFTRWETFNGDYINVSEVGNAYIERCLDTLAFYSAYYPKHPNYPIWVRYTKIFEMELLSRDPETALFVQVS